MFSRKNKYSSLEIAFYKEASHFGEHGQLEVSSRRERLKHQTVAFAFKSMSELPDLTPELMVFIWEEAKAQGYVAHKLISYGQAIGQARVVTDYLDQVEKGAQAARRIIREVPHGFVPTTVGVKPIGQFGTAPNSVTRKAPVMFNQAGLPTQQNKADVSIPTQNFLSTHCQIPDADILSKEEYVRWKDRNVGAVELPSMISRYEAPEVGYRVFDIVIEEDNAVIVLATFDKDAFITAKDVLSAMVNPQMIGIDGYFAKVIRFINDVAINDLSASDRATFKQAYNEFVEQGILENAETPNSLLSRTVIKSDKLEHHVFVPSADLPSGSVSWGGADIRWVKGVINGNHDIIGYNVSDISHASDAEYSDQQTFITARSVLDFVSSFGQERSVSDVEKAILGFTVDVARNDLNSLQRKEFDRLSDELVERGVI